MTQLVFQDGLALRNTISLPNNYLFFQNVHRCRVQRSLFGFLLFKNSPWVPLDSEAKVSSSGLLNTSVQEGQVLNELQTRCLNITFPLLSFL